MNLSCKKSFAFFLLASAACAQAPPAVWIDVPFVRQPREGCGAAAIAMLMQYWAAQSGSAPQGSSEVDTIQQELYSAKDHGILASAMERYLRQNGYSVFTIRGTWSDLESQLRKGRPLIVAVRPQGQRKLHYVIVDGVDPDRELVMMNDPAERKLLTQERAGFERDWKATHNWLLLAVPAPSPH